MSRIYSFILLLILLCALPAGAQKLAVRDFGVHPQDLDAQGSTSQHRERNGMLGDDAKPVRLGEPFSLTAIKGKKVESRQPKRMSKRVSSQGFPSIDEIVGSYYWSSYDTGYSDWVNRYIWIYRSDTDDLLIEFEGFPAAVASYDPSQGVISVESGQMIGNENNFGMDVYFYHYRLDDEGNPVLLETPLKIYADGPDLSVEPDDMICIGNESDMYYASYNNYFADQSRPSGYSRVGKTQLFTRIYENIDVYGLFEGSYYRSTFADGGYRVSLKVNDGYANKMNCSSLQNYDGIDFWANVEQQGEFARISYILRNTMESDAIVSLGTHADVMIGGNDAAPITRRIDTLEQTYGLTMSDGNGAQLCVLFGAGLTGVAAVDDFWFGYYGLNNYPDAMVGNYYSGSNYMVENGNYDSGMGWCWKDRVIPAGETVTFSYLIGVGDVNLEPNFSFAVTPEDPDGWNNLSLPHQLTINGEYESPAGVDGRIEYAVEDSEEWTPLTDMLPSGSEFEGMMTVMFDESKHVHTIRFRTVDNVGNTTMLHPIEYIDVKYIDIAGIEERTYNGNPQVLNISSEQLDQEKYTVSYSNNVNAGTASFRLEGVFPYSIGRSSYYDFKINPLALEGDISLRNDSFVFNNTGFQPEWSFSKESYGLLIPGVDYTVEYRNNTYPGTGTVEVSGIGNYTGTFTKEFTIDKASLTDDLYVVALPEKDIVYDGNPHAATFVGDEGVGAPTFRYVDVADGSNVEAVFDAGSYEIYLRVAEGDYYYGIEDKLLGSFSIFKFDSEEFDALGTINVQLIKAGLAEGWDIESGITSVGTFDGLEIKEGHVVGIDLSSKGLIGEFPVSLLALPHLKKIDVSDNDLSGDLPSTLIAIAAQDPAMLASVDTLKIGGNGFNGNLGFIGQCMTSLEYLDASCNKFEDLYPALPENIKYIDIRGQEIGRTVDLNLSDVNWETLKTQVPTIILYDPATRGVVREVNLLMSSEQLSPGNLPSDDAWSLLLNITADNGEITPFVWGSNTYRGKSGDTLFIYDMSGGELNGSNFNVKLSFEQGDANFFNGIDATDLQATILYAFGAYSNLPFNFTAANTYEDEVINIQDVTCTVNILLSNLAETPEQVPDRRKVAFMEDYMYDARIILAGGKVILYSERPVAALTLKASGDIDWFADKFGLTQKVSGSNLVAYSLSGAEIPAGETVIGEYNSNADIISVSLSDTKALPIAVSVTIDTESGVDCLPFEIDDDCEIYDVKGIRHNDLINGLNIIVRDGKTIRYYNSK